MIRDQVVLVDHDDNETGEMEKLEAHKKGLLHRAFSVFIFNPDGDMLIHQRAYHKYHGAGLWTNACCSHPQAGEDIKAAARERLFYEMGLSCELELLFAFIYKADVENNFIEHEYDHVLTGYTNQQPNPNPSEVNSFRWVSRKTLLKEIDENPEKFTIWFKQALPVVLDRV